MKTIICFTGMPGSGKSIAAEALKKKGYIVLSIGDAVRNEMRRQGIPINIKTLDTFSVEARQNLGKDYAIRLLESEIDEALKTKDTLFVDGIRTMSEIDRLKSRGYKVVALALISDKKTRFERLMKRQRESDPKDLEDFLWREKKQLEMGIAEVIATTDYFLENGNSVSKFQNSLLKKVKFIINSEKS